MKHNLDNKNIQQISNFEDIDLAHQPINTDYLFSSEKLENIHKNTLISINSLTKIAKKEFKTIDRVHFQGFIKILARHYPTYNWDALFMEFEQYQNEDSFDKLNKKIRGFTQELIEPNNNETQNNNSTNQLTKQQSITINDQLDFFEQEKVKENKIKTKTLIIIMFLTVIIMIFITNMPNDDLQHIEENNSFAEENSDTKEENLSSFYYSSSEKKISENIREPKPKIVKDTVYIRPKNKVWLGRIFLDDYSKKSDIIAENGEFKFVPDVDQLLVFGHGQILIEYKENLFNLNSTEKKRFLIQNSEIKEISREEFKNLNKGRIW
jgi:hypothetical protein